MENLPKTVINKIMFYTNHPTADILKDALILQYMKHRIEDDMGVRGSPFRCGVIDTIKPHRFYNPRKFDRTDGLLSFTGEGRRNAHRNLSLEEHEKYTAAYFHFAPMRWKLKEED